MPYAVLAAALVALDQLVKYLVSHNIPLGGHVPLLPHLVELTYFQNTGAAFSMLEEHTWLLTLISVSYTHLDVYKRQGKSTSLPCAEFVRLQRTNPTLTA